jgi:hypothetical protein
MRHIAKFARERSPLTGKLFVSTRVAASVDRNQHDGHLEVRIADTLQEQLHHLDLSGAAHKAFRSRPSRYAPASE